MTTKNSRHALGFWVRELGPDGVARFLRLNRSGIGDYTRIVSSGKRT